MEIPKRIDEVREIPSLSTKDLLIQLAKEYMSSGRKEDLKTYMLETVGEWELKAIGLSKDSTLYKFHKILQQTAKSI